MNNETMSISDWLITLIILSIPVVNVVMFIAWTIGVGNINRVNFCRASILIGIIGVAIFFLIGVLGYSINLHNYNL